MIKPNKLPVVVVVQFQALIYVNVSLENYFVVNLMFVYRIVTIEIDDIIVAMNVWPSIDIYGF